jgi:hypothetical protein
VAYTFKPAEKLTTTRIAVSSAPVGINGDKVANIMDVRIVPRGVQRNVRRAVESN